MRNKTTLMGFVGALAASSLVVAMTSASVRADVEAEVTTVDIAPNLYPIYDPLVGDVTGDGLDDVVHFAFADLDPITDTVAVFAGRSDGSLSAGVTTAYPPNTESFSYAVGDMNGDDRADLVQFQRSCRYSDCDDEPDWKLTVRPGNQDGTFGLPQLVATQSSDASVVLADLDADGKLDIATQSLVGGVRAPGWWRNTGGTFAPFEAFDAPFGSFRGVGQFGGGAADDLLLDDGTSWVVLLDPVTPGTSQVTTLIGTVSGAPSIADVDGDGDDDVLYLSFASSSQWTLRRSGGDGSFGPAIDIQPRTVRSDAVLADVDGTGRYDIVFFDAGNAVSVIDPEGAVAPDPVAQVGVPLVSRAVVGNFDGSGTDDVIRASNEASAFANAFKIFRFPQPNPDADADGILDAVDADGGTGASPGEFGDANVSGTIVSSYQVAAGRYRSPTHQRPTASGSSWAAPLGPRG